MRFRMKCQVSCTFATRYVLFGEFHDGGHLITHQPQLEAQGCATLERGPHRGLLAYVSFSHLYTAYHPEADEFDIFKDHPDCGTHRDACCTWCRSDLVVLRESFFLMRSTDKSLGTDDHGRTSTPRKIMLPLRM